jgi:glycosyltransferase involved in cell wall biosynthesis
LNRSARLWVDITTSVEDIGRIPHGTLRVERGIAAAMTELNDGCIGFVAFDRREGRFFELSRQVADEIVTASTEPERTRELAGVWKRRAWAMQGRATRLFSFSALARPAVSVPADVPFADGDTLLLPSEHDRHDFACLTRLKRTRHLKLAFVFYDLLRVLNDDDPKLAALDPTGLPQTEFMVREADLLLPISHYSARILREHLRRRGASSVPVEPIRLAADMLPAANPPEPIAGLVPGGFVLSVGDVVHRKNHKLLVQVWSTLIANGIPVPTLAIVGRIDMEGNAIVRSVRRDPRLSDIVRFLPNVSDAALLWLYRNCRYTVFPSLLEGFGLPVAESLRYGKVCLASSNAAIPEAGQGAAVSLDPLNADAWAAEVARLNDPAALAAAERRISESFRTVTWSDTVADIRDAVER